MKRLLPVITVILVLAFVATGCSQAPTPKADTPPNFTSTQARGIVYSAIKASTPTIRQASLYDKVEFNYSTRQWIITTWASEDDSKKYLGYVYIVEDATGKVLNPPPVYNPQTTQITPTPQTTLATAVPTPTATPIPAPATTLPPTPTPTTPNTTPTPTTPAPAIPPANVTPNATPAPLTPPPTPTTPVGSSPSAKYLFDNEAKIISSEERPVFLGRISNKYDNDSILNRYGNYGSKYSSDSVFNRYSSYGGAYSSYSPFNKYTSTPPKIYIGDTFWGYLSRNKYLSTNTLDPNDLLMFAYLKYDDDRYLELMIK